MTATERIATREVILVGRERTPIDERADQLLDGCTMALQEFDTDTLLAIADLRDSINPGGWMQAMIRGYVEVWR